MLHPVSITDRQNRNHWNRQKNSRHSSQLFTREDRKDHRERMKMNTLTDESWIDRVVLSNSQHTEKHQHQESIKWTSMKHREQSGENRDSNWSNKRNELEATRQDSHDQTAWQAQHSETEGANYTN